MALIDKLTAIADAIRGKNGETKLYTLDEMPVAISEISGGAEGGEETFFHFVKITNEQFAGSARRGTILSFVIKNNNPSELKREDIYDYLYKNNHTTEKNGFSTFGIFYKSSSSYLYCPYMYVDRGYIWYGNLKEYSNDVIADTVY